MAGSKKNNKAAVALALLGLLLWGCSTPAGMMRTENRSVPEAFNGKKDTTNTGKLKWKDYFSDPDLAALIDVALQNNQELNITMQEIQISKNEIRARKGEYLPFLGLRAGAGIDKAGDYTWREAVTDNLNPTKNKEAVESNNDFMVGAFASWEIDVWKKLRNSKKSAALRYLATTEGRNFMVTNLVSEIATSYYELLALDNMLDIIEKNIEIQSEALQIVKLQKESAKVTQLAVNRFEAQLLNTQNLQYDIRQQIVVTENKINYLMGRFPQPIKRNSISFNNLPNDTLLVGVPSQLLNNRPDIKQAEWNLAASKLDVKVARANFFPSVRIQAGAGFNAFNPALLINPYSLLYSLAGDLMAPLVNRNAIQAMYKSSGARQVQAAYTYEQTILNAYMEVLNQMAKNTNYSKSFDTKKKEVDILNQSINISNNLFKSARADYIEILTTQQEALESKMELIEIKTKQIHSRVELYRALGGGWN